MKLVRPVPLALKPQDVLVRVVSTTDVHMHLCQHDYYHDTAQAPVGLTRLARLIEDVRRDCPNTLLLDNGDFLQGNPMGDFLALGGTLADGEVHAAIAAMNAMEYDAGTLGNHEFNYGIEFLDKALAAARFPMVCANFVRRRGPTPDADETYLPPYTILDRVMRRGDGEDMPIRIGVIGFVPPQILAWDRRHLRAPWAVRGIVEAARHWVPRMQAEGTDIVVALCHSGISEGPAHPMSEHAAVDLSRVEGIDALILGHQHKVFPGGAFEGPGIDTRAGRLHGKPAVMAGFWGSHLGLIDLALRREGNRWQVRESQSQVLPAPAETGLAQESTPRLARFHEGVSEWHERTLAHVRRPIGICGRRLHSFFSLAAPCPAISTIANAQRRFAEEALRGTAWEHVPLLSAASPAKVGGTAGAANFTDVPEGPIAIRHVADIYPFPNTIRAVRVTGAALRDWLEQAAGIFRTLVPGSHLGELVDPGFPAYNFDVIEGVTYRIDISAPPRFDLSGQLVEPASRRIRDLRWQGKRVRDDMDFVVVTNNYRADGGGDFAALRDAEVVLESRTSSQSVVQDLLSGGWTAPSMTIPTWRFVPLPDTSALFASSPKAMDCAEEVACHGIRSTHRFRDGYALFTLRFPG